MDLAKITQYLENMDDQEQAVELLSRFNELSAQYHQILVNKDVSLTHQEWKELCDRKQQDLENFILQSFRDL